MPEFRNDPLNDLERALEELTPKPLAIDRDRLMYQAGLAAAASRTRGAKPSFWADSFWKMSTGVMTAATLAFAVMLTGRGTDDPSEAAAEAGNRAAEATAPSPPVVEAVVAQDASAPPVNAEPVGSALWRPVRSPSRFGDPATNYLALRAVILERGLDDWPVRRSKSGGAIDHADQRRRSTAGKLLREMLPKLERRAPPDNRQPVGISPRDEESFV